MPIERRYTYSLQGEWPGSQNNLKGVALGDQTNTWIKFTDSGGNLNNNKPLNGLGQVEMLDNPSGGTNEQSKQLTLAFDRNGVTAAGITYKFKIVLYNMWGAGDTEGVLKTFTQYLSPNAVDTLMFPGHTLDTTTNQGMAKFWLNMMLNKSWYDENNSAVSLQPYFKCIDYSDGSEIRATDYYWDSNGENGTGPDEIGSSSGIYGFKLEARSPYNLSNFTAQLLASGGLKIKKFENVPAFETSGVDWISKDIDFGFPGVRKKIYKVIITYKGPVDMSGNDYTYTNITPLYAVDGKMQLRNSQDGVFLNADWYNFDITNLFSTKNHPDNDGETGNLPDMRWIRQELKPAGDAPEGIWNNVYSIALRLKSYNFVKSFEVNDISIIYRLKGLK